MSASGEQPWKKLMEENRHTLKGRFNGSEKMKKEWEGAVDEYFTEQEAWVVGQGAWLGRLFYEADVDSDDKLSPSEVGGLLQDWVTNVIMKDVAENEARRLFEKYDMNKNGTLEIDEFKALGRELGVRYKCFLQAEGEIQRRIFAKRQHAQGVSGEESTNLNMVIEDGPVEKKPRLDDNVAGQSADPSATPKTSSNAAESKTADAVVETGASSGAAPGAAPPAESAAAGGASATAQEKGGGGASDP